MRRRPHHPFKAANVKWNNRVGFEVQEANLPATVEYYRAWWRERSPDRCFRCKCWHDCQSSITNQNVDRGLHIASVPLGLFLATKEARGDDHQLGMSINLHLGSSHCCPVDPRLQNAPTVFQPCGWFLSAAETGTAHRTATPKSLGRLLAFRLVLLLERRGRR